MPDQDKPAKKHIHKQLHGNLSEVLRNSAEEPAGGRAFERAVRAVACGPAVAGLARGRAQGVLEQLAREARSGRVRARVCVCLLPSSRI